MPDKIHDLNSLERAIAELEAKKTSLEAKLEMSASHLQKNFMSMAYRSVVPKSTAGTGPMAAAGEFFKTELKGEKLKDGLSRVVGSFSGMASEGLETLINKFKGNKQDKTA